MLENAIKEQYHNVMDAMLDVQADSHSSQILSRLELISDDTEDLYTLFKRDPGLLAKPGFLLDILRLVHFSSRLKRELGAQYDNFVSSYQLLSTRENRDDDESKLFQEIGDLMYQIDDLSGRHERLSDRLIKTMIRSLIDLLRTEQSDDSRMVYSTAVREDIQLRFRPLIEELLTLSASLYEQIAIMHALSRMRRLIIES